jgi:hypothetical protein
MHGPDNKPLLLLSREGDGRVALLLSDHIWLWARGYEGGGPHIDLLRRLSWLMKQPDLEEEALRMFVRGRDLTVQRQSMSDNVSEVTSSSQIYDWAFVRHRAAGQCSSRGPNAIQFSMMTG